TAIYDGWPGPQGCLQRYWKPSPRGMPGTATSTRSVPFGAGRISRSIGIFAVAGSADRCASLGSSRLWGNGLRHRYESTHGRCDGDVLSPTLPQAIPPQPASRPVPSDASGNMTGLPARRPWLQRLGGFVIAQEAHRSY